MKTYSAKPSEVKRTWFVIDASSAPLGRVSTAAATLLSGKHKPMFTNHIDCGDYVVIINAGDLKVSGSKTTDKMYYRHSGHPGNLKSQSLQEKMELDPTTVIRHAVRGMLPKNKLIDARLERLKVYAGADHQHEAQKPTSFNVKEQS